MDLAQDRPIDAPCQPIGRHVGRSARRLRSIARYAVAWPANRICLSGGKASPTAWEPPALFQTGENTMEKILGFIVAMHIRVADIRDNDRGATATEYALLVSFIAIAIIVGVTAFGGALNSFFKSLGTTVSGLGN
jgi:pilus assembly protein Flp/PilA